MRRRAEPSAPEDEQLRLEVLQRLVTLIQRAGLQDARGPRSGREREGRTSSTSHSTRSTSPGRVAEGQFSSAPAPIMPPECPAASCASSRMVMAAVCQPLATSVLKNESLGGSLHRDETAAGRTGAANALICAASSACVSRRQAQAHVEVFEVQARRSVAHGGLPGSLAQCHWRRWRLCRPAGHISAPCR